MPSHQAPVLPGVTVVNNNLNFDSDTLFIDSANNRVGILISVPTVAFHVDGDVKITGAIELDGALNHDGSTAGFFGVTPASRPSAYTQSYSTANKTHAARTAATLTDNTGQSAVGTLPQIDVQIQPGGAPGQGADPNGLNAALGSIAVAVASLAAQVNKLIADQADTAQIVNSVIDDLQTLGLLQ
jgi:hypothetical protein